MDLSQAILLRNSLRQNHVIMAYNGTVSDDLMVTLADLLKERLVANDDVKRSKLIFAVFMEGVQNLIWHGKEQSISRRKAGYLPRIWLRQQNLKHGHDRHSGNI